MSGDFEELNEPLLVYVDCGSLVRFRVLSITGLFLHSDLSLQYSIERLTRYDRTSADFISEDEAYKAIIHYYNMHGLYAPYHKIQDVWLPIDHGDDKFIKKRVIESETMEFE